ncbi:MAG TPA: helix-turn-helix domain-containing protein [Candidatus Limnocylindria bacterium]|nr:helix-turn-helix domain-containing protein [Candidatus Limnocylindria bacterium]
MLDDTTLQGIEDLAVLAEPVRRRLYLHVAAQSGPVSRDEAAAAVEIGRPLAAHHLDRLVQAGLLNAEYQRRSGRSGPGAGRPAKLYRAAARELRVTLPQRRYEVAAELMAATIGQPSGGLETLEDVAHRYGSTLGSEARRRAGPRAGAAKRRTAVASVLRDAGYQPVVRDGEVRLLNCPFHELAQRHRDVTCNMNLAMLRGILAGAGLPEGAARLDPQPGTCCVAID